MKTIHYLSVLFVSSLFCLPAYAAGLPPESRINQFFQTLTNRGSEKAYEVLFEGSPFAQAKSKDLDRLKADLNQYLTNSPAIGFERVKEQIYGRSVLKLVYVLKLESRPLVWTFHFYRARTVWSLSRVGFDEDVRQLD